jgi:hypothetical protein
MNTILNLQFANQKFEKWIIKNNKEYERIKLTQNLADN